MFSVKDTQGNELAGGFETVDQARDFIETQFKNCNVKEDSYLELFQDGEFLGDYTADEFDYFYN